ncbi:MAG: flavodoxin domain-containing protein [Anaerolineae bacterium]|nr:flavodoxin domain-containing protein [Anaerolineae bacterium]
MKKILVAYASKYGATAEIAAAIANTLGENELDVKVISADAVNEVQSYDAVVLGSAVYAGHWLQGAVDFLDRFKKDLGQKPVWLFSSGPTGDGDALELLNGWKIPEALQPTVSELKVRDVALFHGKIDTRKLNLAENLLVRAMRGATGDFRDWDAIRAWAETMVTSLVKA